MVARSGEDFFRFWSGHKVDLSMLESHMEEGLAQRRAYEGAFHGYFTQWWFQNYVLDELTVSILFIIFPFNND